LSPLARTWRHHCGQRWMQRRSIWTSVRELAA